MFSPKYLEELQSLFLDSREAFDVAMEAEDYLRARKQTSVMRQRTFKIREVGWHAFNELDFDGAAQAFKAADRCDDMRATATRRLLNILFKELESAGQN